jgi:light-regulated signal transduction histidine kinase (bacteriophytochrome)
MSEPLSSAAASCAQEAIHLSGAIQPHGYLVACTLPDWVIVQVSANIGELLDAPWQELLRQSLRDHVGDDVLQHVLEVVDALGPDAPAQHAAIGNVGAKAHLCDFVVHVADGMVHLELEPQQRQGRVLAPTLVAQRLIARISGGMDMVDFHQRVADEIRTLSGYDRVMVYRFRHDEAGEVVAESRADGIESFLGLRFPASDIPAQARALYVRNRIRVIPDAAYDPIPILPGRTALGAPLDLSQHVLRSVSPVHVEYLANMGVAASMSISLVVGGRLWGLVACHHRQPRPLPATVRAVMDMVGQFSSMRVAAAEQEVAGEQDDRARDARERLALRLSEGEDPSQALAQALPILAGMIPSDGIALRSDGHWTSFGRTPATDGLEQALQWARGRGIDRMPTASDAAAWAAPDAGHGLAGVLAVPFGRRDDWLLYFRQEQVEDVTWAGDPNKPMVPTDDGIRIAPRKSFAAWRDTVRGHALPWTDAERAAAERLRQMLQERPWQPLPDDAANIHDMQLFRRRHVISEQKSRLDMLATLLSGMGHLEDEHTARISRRIADLEAELRQLMHGHEAGPAATGGGESTG